MSYQVALVDDSWTIRRLRSFGTLDDAYSYAKRYWEYPQPGGGEYIPLIRRSGDSRWLTVGFEEEMTPSWPV
jgi:hypothetical protein